MGAVLMICLPSSRLGGWSHLWVLCWGSHPCVLPDLHPQQQVGGGGSHLWVLC